MPLNLTKRSRQRYNFHISIPPQTSLERYFEILPELDGALVPRPVLELDEAARSSVRFALYASTLSAKRVNWSSIQSFF